MLNEAEDARKIKKMKRKPLEALAEKLLEARGEESKAAHGLEDITKRAAEIALDDSDDDDDDDGAGDEIAKPKAIDFQRLEKAIEGEKWKDGGLDLQTRKDGAELGLRESVVELDEMLNEAEDARKIKKMKRKRLEALAQKLLKARDKGTIKLAAGSGGAAGAEAGASSGSRSLKPGNRCV